MKRIALFTALTIALTANFAADAGDNNDNLVGKVPFLTGTAQDLDYSKSPTHPFINSALPNPPESEYSGPLFQLRHDYPSSVPSNTDYPWKAVTNNGPITQENAMAYVEALKAYVSDDMRKLIYNYNEWDAPNEPWWPCRHVPW